MGANKKPLAKMDVPVVHSGWLKKKPPANKSLTKSFKKNRTRMFYLSRDRLLQYYDDADRSVRKGAIDLSNMVGLEQFDNGFVIHSISRDWQLYSIAATAVERQRDVARWVGAITQLLAPVPSSVARRFDSGSVAFPEAPVEDRFRTFSISFDPNSIRESDHMPSDRSSELWRSDSSATGVDLGRNVGSIMRKQASQSRARFVKDGFDLDLSHITPRIIAMGCPSEDSRMFRNSIEDVQRFFETYHNGCYRVYNLCTEPMYDSNLLKSVEFGFEENSPPPLQLIEKFCTDVEQFLSSDPANVAAIHGNRGSGQSGTLIACYLLKSNHSSTPAAALDCYSTQRTMGRKGVTIPSQFRYIDYYHRILSSGTSPAQPPQVLQPVHVSFDTVPGFDRVVGGSCPFLRIYLGKGKVFDQRKAAAWSLKGVRRAGEWEFDLRPYSITLSGDCKFVFCHLDVLGSYETMFHFWLNTRFVPDNGLVHFKRADLDGASNDREGRFDNDFGVRLQFEISSEAAPPPPPSPTPRSMSGDANHESESEEDVAYHERLEENLSDTDPYF
eukprot:c16003_g1_i1.p1 GENE.c16003_g1_i1~~c16003_g1_i1.p1  ORF type:complete len:556 (+),score=122.10 c16003_g1_i1:3-1670(+)